MTGDNQPAHCNDIIEDVYIPYTSKSVSQLKDFFKSISSLNIQIVEKIQSSDLDNQKIRSLIHTYQQRKIDTFNDFYTDKDKLFPEIPFEGLLQKAEEFISSFPPLVKREQSSDRFRSQPKDPGIIKFLKIFKRGIFNISVIPRRLWNLARIMIGRKKRPIPYWDYSIPVQEIARYVVYQKLVVDLKTATESLIQQCLKIAFSILHKDQEINRLLLDQLDQLKTAEILEISNIDDSSSFDKVLEKFKEEIKNIARICDEEIVQLEEVVGTIDYPSWLLQWRTRSKLNNRKSAHLENNLNYWGNTVFAMLEDWKIDQEIYWLKVNTEKSVNELRTAISEKHDPIIDQLKIINQQINIRKNEIQAILSNESVDYTQIQEDTLNRIRTGSIKQNIILAVEQLLKFNLPSKINDFELNLLNLINSLSEKRWLTRKSDYTNPIKPSDLSSFSLQELIRAGCYPELSEKCAELKALTVSEIERLRNEILNIEEVVVFNFSAVVQRDETGLIKKADIPSLFSEGAARTQGKIDFIAAEVEDFSRNTASRLFKITENFTNSTLELTKNESAFELRMIIMKAKALKKTGEIGARSWDFIKNKVSVSIAWFQNALTNLNTFITPWRQKIGFGTIEKGISSEISDFLSEAHRRINNLPIIYQILYRIEPLTEMTFFIGREKEIEQLKHAYKNFQESKFAPTVIVGEKSCGNTTLLNYLNINYLDKSMIISGSLSRNLSLPSEFFDFWKNVLKIENINTLDDLTRQILSLPKGKIIIIENIHNFYLRTIHGFENINLLIRLIAGTYNHVFWLFSANKYIWDYLTKTMELPDYFGYVIEMTPFNDKELRELIIKKNSVSGYRIHFMHSSINANSKKFKALDENEKQTYLRNEFFHELNNYAKGNVSLCLTYWLLSTGEISENKIEIVKFSPPDVSFIKRLNTEIIFILFLIIMHDGLTFDQLCLVYQKPVDKIRSLLIMLSDDGVIIDEEGYYEVNPLIYRQTIEMLKARNLIH